MNNTKFNGSYWEKMLLASHLVSRAIKKGQLIRPSFCSSCNLEFPKDKIHAHHDDYNKPMEILWLCPKCHGKRTKELNKEIAKQELET